MAGRFAPSPSGPLHLGNLRTALIAWLVARSDGVPFYVRVEDLDPVTSTRANEEQQLADLARLGLDWDDPVVRQSERFDLYRDAIDWLDRRDLVYRCFCTRREIRDEIERSSRAPQVDTSGNRVSPSHRPDGAYPGTCRGLTAEESAERAVERAPALRLRTEGQVFDVADRIAGKYRGGVDDLVLARADQLPAYNLAVVVDDHLQGVTQVVRGDDLLSSTPRHLLLYELFGWAPPEYWHVPLVMDGDVRLAKRSGGVTLGELEADGWSSARVLGSLGHSFGLASPGESVSIEVLLGRFDPDALPTAPVQVEQITRLPDGGAS